jgi:hypothetical protein
MAEVAKAIFANKCKSEKESMWPTRVRKLCVCLTLPVQATMAA